MIFFSARKKNSIWFKQIELILIYLSLTGEFGMFHLDQRPSSLVRFHERVLQPVAAVPAD